MKKVILFLVCCCIFSLSANADNKPYIGLKYQQLYLDRSLLNGYDLDNLAPTDFTILDIHIGINFNNNFYTEVGYLKSEKATMSGSQTVGGIKITATNVSQEFSGFRAGTGYKFKINNNFRIIPFINYINIDVDTSGTWVASSGTQSVTAKFASSASEAWTEGGLGLSYIYEKVEFGLSYSRSLYQPDDIDNTYIYSATISYQFN